MNVDMPLNKETKTFAAFTFIVTKKNTIFETLFVTDSFLCLSQKKKSKDFINLKI